MNDYLTTRELYHHGIKGQKWGVRRFQNEDGSLTDAGKKLKTNTGIGITTGALAGAGIGYGLARKNFKQTNFVLPYKGAKEFVDANSGASARSWVTSRVLKVAGAAFVGGLIGRKIARKATLASIKRADKAAAKVEKQVEKTASKINDEVTKYE